MKPLYTLKDGVPGVRLAIKEDEGEVFALLLMLHAENGMFGLNRDKVLAGIQSATERRGGLIYVIERDSRVVATMGLSIVSDWYSDDEYLLERWTFVHPEYRKGDLARRLLEQGKWTSDWFTSNGSRPMPFQCGINSLERTEAKIRLYARHMACIGAAFMYGEPPRQGDKVEEEMRHLEEVARKARRERTKEVRSTVEAIIRASQKQEEGAAVGS